MYICVRVHVYIYTIIYTYIYICIITLYIIIYIYMCVHPSESYQTYLYQKLWVIINMTMLANIITIPMILITIFVSTLVISILSHLRKIWRNSHKLHYLISGGFVVQYYTHHWLQHWDFQIWPAALHVQVAIPFLRVALPAFIGVVISPQLLLS
jgi:hypothetical protein